MVYDGPLSGISEKLNLQKEYLSLGTLSSGDSKGLTVELAMDNTYTNNDFMVKSVMENIWEFRAVKTKEPSPSKPGTGGTKVPGWLPQTGEEWRDALISICLGLFLLMSVLLIMKKRKSEQQKS